MRHLAIFLSFMTLLATGLTAYADSYTALSATLPPAVAGTRIVSDTVYSIKSGEALMTLTGSYRGGTDGWYPILEGRYSEGGNWYETPEIVYNLVNTVYTVTGPADVRVVFECSQTTTEEKAVKVILFKSVKESAVATAASNVVVPTDAAGQVEIIIESSADLINWVQALPGAYDASVTNRFFRLRAVVHNEG